MIDMQDFRYPAFSRLYYNRMYAFQKDTSTSGLYMTQAFSEYDFSATPRDKSFFAPFSNTNKNKVFP